MRACTWEAFSGNMQHDADKAAGARPADQASTPLREIILGFGLACSAPQRCIRSVISIGYPVGPQNYNIIREDRMKRHRPYLVGAAMGLFAAVAIAGTPAMATPCTNLQSLQLDDTTITSATDNTSHTFVPPGSPTPITGLPAF